MGRHDSRKKKLNECSFLPIDTGIVPMPPNNLRHLADDVLDGTTDLQNRDGFVILSKASMKQKRAFKAAPDDHTEVYNVQAIASKVRKMP
jgi:hypothetical protein